MEQPERQDVGTSRMRLLLNLASFQFKLFLDWLRDLLLAPASFFAVMYGIIAGGDKPDQYYNRLMAYGRRTDRFINLFDEYSDDQDPNQKKSDDYMAPYKDRLMQQAETSGMTEKANKLVDGLVTKNKPQAPDQATLAETSEPPQATPTDKDP
ncbi:MAG: hypothetical protein AB8B93_08220 [Pseudomonadales bacterium]